MADELKVIQKYAFTLQGSLFKDIIGANANYILYDYKLNGVTATKADGTTATALMDFQTTLQMASLQRAKRVEEQVQPLADIIQERNKQLEELGKGLAAVGSIEAQIPGDADPDFTLSENGKDNKKLSSENVANGKTLIGVMNKYFHKGWSHNTWNRSELKDSNQLLKTEIDKLNADSQADMTRLQGIMDKRDQGFTLASDLMTKDCDNISALIRNITP